MSKGAVKEPARVAAKHCPDFLQTISGTAEPVIRFEEISEDLSRSIAAMVQGLLGGARQKATCSPNERVKTTALLEQIGPRACNAMVSFGTPDRQILVSLGLNELLRLTDRVFGGEGEAPDELPEELPLTADLVASKIETIVCDALANTLHPATRPEINGRASDAARLEAFGKAKECVSFTVTIAEPEQKDWSFTLAMQPECFTHLFSMKTKPALPAPKRVNNPMAEPFADLPIDLEAVMAEFSLPLARLSSLAPGDTIPLALSRQIPLKISETIIAYGTVGATDERVALQLTRAF